jgi:ABC-type transporter Mla subunit MlaD
MGRKKEQKRTMENNLQLVLGIAMFLLFLGAILFGISYGFIFKQRYIYMEISFDYIEGIRAGSAVKINGGYTIGKVISVTSLKNKHFVFVQIDGDIKIPKKNVQFSIYTTGFIGAKYINIFSLYKTEPYIKNGDVFIGNSPGNVNQSLIFFSKLLDEKPPEDSQNFEKLVLNTRDTVINLNKKLKKVEFSINKNIFKTRNDLQGALKSINGIINFLEKNAKVYETLDKNYKLNLQQTLNSVYSITSDLYLKLNQGAQKRTKFIGKFLFEETQYEKVRQFAQYIREVLDKFSDEPFYIFNKE